MFFIAYKLLQWGKKRVRFRDLFSDIKQGFSVLIKKERQTVEEISQKKDQLSQKKEPKAVPVLKKKKALPVKRTAPATKSKVVKTSVVKKTVAPKKSAVKKPQKKVTKPTTALKKTPLKTGVKKTGHARKK